MSDVAAYHVFVCGGYFIIIVYLCVQRTHKYMICCHITHNKEIFIILTRDFSKEQHMLPEVDMWYATETCRSILSILV